MGAREEQKRGGSFGRERKIKRVEDGKVQDD
jgi:hypothetical protein